VNSTNDQEHMAPAKAEWVSAVVALTLPLAIIAVAIGCQYFV
jgi:hypothetical protein